jgi:PAS domain S-box-containing protein
MLKSATPKSKEKSLALVFGVGLLLQASGLLMDSLLGDAWRFANIPLHAGIEMAGAVIAMLVAYLLIRADESKDGGSFDRLIASALIGMGFLDGLHALMPPGNLFVWFHSFATLLGGLLFTLIWAGPQLPTRVLKAAPVVALGTAIVGGIGSLLWPQLLPNMLQSGAFTPAALAMNLVGGICMLAAAVKLFLAYKRNLNPTDLLFCLQCALFGTAAVMFEHSKVWDAPWWTWHVLRLAGYAVSLQFVLARIESRGLLRQIEQRSQNEQLIRNSNALLSTLDMHAIISAADRAGYITEVNDAFCKISGYSRQELIGENHRIVNSGVQSREFWVSMWKTISDGKPWRGQVCNRAKNGTLYWVDTFIAPFVGDDGLVDKYVSIRTDITASKLAEEKVKLSSALLEESQRVAKVGGWELNAVTGELFWTAETYRIHETSSEVFNPTVDAGVSHFLPESRLRIESALQAALTQGIAYDLELETLTTKGNRIDIRTTGTPWFEEDKIVQLSGIFQDITDRKIRERQLEEARKIAEEAAQSKGQFLANMSHEIRTPMNAILGMLSLLQSTDMTARQRDYTSKSESAAKSLLGLLNDILDYSKVEAGKMSLEKAPFRIDQLLRNLAVILSSNGGSKDIEVLFDVDNALPEVVLGDAMRLQQVLINLGGNAVKFTSAGQVVVSLRILDKTPDAATIEFSVQDTGIGIAPEHQAHIFSGFSQAEGSTTRLFGGTGLGLAISKRFVELMGDDIRISSTLGVGSTFSFALTLPIADQVSVELGRLPHTPPQPQRTLVIDDNDIAGELLQKMVRSWGWDAQRVRSGAQALDLISAQWALLPAQFPFPLIYIDWHMPDMDGWETARRILNMARERNATPPTVIMVTANGRETLAQRTDVEQAMLSGFLVKPFTASMLMDAFMDASSGKTGVRSPSRGRSIQRQLAGMRILVVEDNLINQQVADELLSAQGAIVSLAANGRLGVDAVAAAAPQFDVVLMDVQMPVMDGYGATKVIREELGLAQLPIIAMTANAMASDRDACLASGMNEHIGKPFDMTQLVSLLIKWTGLDAAGGDEVSAMLVEDPARAPTLPQIPGLDIATALARMSGMRTLYVRTARDFSRVLGDFTDELRQRLQGGESKAALMLLHTLKGNAGTLGVKELADMAAALEKCCKAGDLGECLEALTGLEALIQATRGRLAQAIAELAPADLPKTTQSNLALNTDQVVAALDELKLLAGSSDMSLLQRFAELRNTLAPLPEEFCDRLDGALQEFDFEAAKVLCEEQLARMDA